MPITYGTAHGALVWRAGLKAGETLLIHGAAGGVGLAAVEVGKALGAQVIATASSEEKRAVARAHGADHALLSSDPALREAIKDLTAGRGVDVVFDPVGGALFDLSLRAIAWNGRLVVIGFASGEVPQIPANILLVKNVAALGLYWGSYRKHAPDLVAQQFAEIFSWVEAGQLNPLISDRVPLAEAKRALDLLAGRKAKGKVVLTTGQEQ